MKEDFKKNIGFIGWCVLLLFLNIRFSNLPVSHVVGSILGVIGALWIKKEYNNNLVFTGVVVMIAGKVLEFLSAFITVKLSNSFEGIVNENFSVIFGGGSGIDINQMAEALNAMNSIFIENQSIVNLSIVIQFICITAFAGGVCLTARGVKALSSSEEAIEKLGKAGNKVAVYGVSNALFTLIAGFISFNFVTKLVFVVDNTLTVSGLSDLRPVGFIAIIGIIISILSIAYLVCMIKVIYQIFNTQNSGEAKEIQTEIKYE